MENKETKKLKTINFNNEYGITIISLIVTIMILLILAGVATQKLPEMTDIVQNTEDISSFVSNQSIIDAIENDITDAEAQAKILNKDFTLENVINIIKNYGELSSNTLETSDGEKIDVTKIIERYDK